MEIWKDIKGYEGLYQISNLNRVKSLRNDRILSSHYSCGYLKTCLFKDGVTKKHWNHRLIAIAFIDNPKNKPQVNHRNGDKADNRIENLEWCTHKENMNHAHRIGLFPELKNHKKGGDAHDAVAVNQYDMDGNLINSFTSIVGATINTEFNKSGICECAKGKRKKHKGFVWRYANTP